MLKPQLIIIYLFLLALCAESFDNITFPKILWVYWQQGFQNAPLFTQLSIKNKQLFASKSGWEVRFLTEQTIPKYIDVSAIDQMMQLAQDKLVQLRADILRMMLIYQYGGMWMDANSLFLRQLDWVDRISTDSRIYNKLTTPEILIAGYTRYSHGGNITYHFDQKYNQTINLFPGLQNWFILAKPKSLFLADALQKLKVILKTKKKVMDQQILKEGIILSKQHLDPYLIGSDYLFQIVLQSKQKELQKSRSETKYAVYHYKIWHFEADESVYKFTVYSRFKRYQMWADLITYSLNDLRDALPESPNFLKFVGWQHPQFSLYLQNYALFNCWGGDSLIQSQSVIDKYLIQSSGSNLTASISQISSRKNDQNVCKSKINSEYQQSNHQEAISLVIHMLFACLLMGMLLFVKLIDIFCERSLKFEQIPYSYR